MKLYVYKGVEYKSEHQVRQAIWQTERKVFAKCEASEEWAQHGVEICFKDEAIASPPREPSLDELKQMKTGSLDVAFNEYRKSSKTYLVSSLGFIANANVTAFDNVSGLVAQLQFKVDNGEEKPQVGFMSFDDELVMLGLEEMKILLVEISINASNVYAQKWSIRQAIQEAKSKESLEAIEIAFEGPNFTIKG